MFFIVKKSDKTVLYASGTYSPNDPADSVILARAVADYGGAESDYLVPHIDNEGNDAARILAGDQYSLTWSGDDLTGVDFSTEDTKRWLRFSSDRAAYKSGERAILRLQVLTANKAGVDTALSTTINIAVGRGAAGAVVVAFNVIKGLASRMVAIDGPWTMPMGKPAGYRVDNKLTITLLV